jgi:phosphoesterase RecJ-like protein
MEPEIKKLEQLIKDAQTILITSHIGPDGDSVSSSLLLKLILQNNYPDKTIVAVMEEASYGLNFLPGLDQIKVQPLKGALAQFKPQLLVILDANTVLRLTRGPDEVRQYLDSMPTKIVIVDHHEKVDIEKNDLYINNFSPAVTLDIYEIFLERLKMKKPADYAQIAMTGIYTDTGGFVYRNLNYIKTFEVIPKLIADGADVEKLASDLSVMSVKSAVLFREFMNNMHFENEYTYSFLSDETAGDKSPENIEAIKRAADLIRTIFLRNIVKRKWGFIVYKDALADGLTYSVSFRSLSNHKDVSTIANKLGGGGHKPAAGAKFEASSIEDAINKIKEVVTET